MGIYTGIPFKRRGIHILLKCAWNILQDILKLMKIEIISNSFSGHCGMKHHIPIPTYPYLLLSSSYEYPKKIKTLIQKDMICVPLWLS